MNAAYSEALALLGAASSSHEAMERAGQLLSRAAMEGHAEASERCAMFEAFGMARPQSWARALDYLELAASQGSRSAQLQLLLLVNGNRDPVVPPDVGASFWSETRVKVDIEARVKAGEKISLRDAPRLRCIKSFATPAECRWLIGTADHRLAPATIFDAPSGAQSLDADRNNSCVALGVMEMNVVTEVIRHRMSSATGLPVPLFEPSQLLHYAVGQSFGRHFDFLDPANPAYREHLERFGQRVATFLIYLNDGYSGGETSFPLIDLDLHFKVGDALFFANVTGEGLPDPLTLHAGLPVKQGEKWVFSQWIRDRLRKT